MPKARAPLWHDRGEANSCSAGHERESARASDLHAMILTFDGTSWCEVKYIDLWCILRMQYATNLRGM
jgi:hypothetical protein